MHFFSAPEARGWEERTRRLPGPADGGRRTGNAMRDTDEATGTRPLWTVLLGLLVLGLVTSAVPGAARGSHGGGHGGHGGGHGHHGFGHHHHGGGHGGPGFFGPGLGVSIWPYWDPYWAPYWDPYWALYAAPPLVVAPPKIYVQPAEPLWYSCANPQGYYPYVPHCPGGWHPIAPVPPGVPPSSPQPSWYYCANPQGYYPYVHECPEGWQPVAPTSSEEGSLGVESLSDARTPPQR